MSEGESTWHDRRESVRKRYQELMEKAGLTTSPEAPMTPETTGSAGLLDAISADPSATAAVSASASIATSATATAKSTTVSASPSSTISAVTTRPISDSATVWTISPTGWREAILKTTIVEPNGSLIPGLPVKVQESLAKLATANGWPVEEVIGQIADWFVEEEDERAEGTMRDALTFYCENYT